MLKTTSRQYEGEIIVNYDKVLYIAQTLDGLAIIHFEGGTTLSTSEQYQSLSDKIFQKEISVKEENVSKKKFDDPFPDEFPRHGNGKINKQSNLYKKFIENHPEYSNL